MIFIIDNSFCLCNNATNTEDNRRKLSEEFYMHCQLCVFLLLKTIGADGLHITEYLASEDAGYKCTVQGLFDYRSCNSIQVKTGGSLWTTYKFLQKMNLEQ